MQKTWIGAVALTVVSCAVSMADAQVPVGTSFTYQGELLRDGVAISELCGCEFRLFDQEAGGSQVGSTESQNVMFQNGLFTVDLDYGSAAFDPNRQVWLEVSVQCFGDADPEVLSPRQRVGAVPFALAGLQPTSGDELIAGTGLQIDGNVISITPGGVSSLQVANESLTSVDLAVNSVGSSEISPGAIGSSAIQSDPLILPKVSDGLLSSQIRQGVFSVIPPNSLGTSVFSNLPRGIHLGFGASGAPRVHIRGDSTRSATIDFSRSAGLDPQRESFIALEDDLYLTVAISGLRVRNRNDSFPNSQTDLVVEGTAANFTGSWSILSDRRLKQGVTPIVNPLDRLLELRGVEFEYRRDVDVVAPMAGSRRIGFVSQEVESVFPSWVSDTDSWKSIAPIGFEGLAVEALRELRAEKDDQIAALRDANEALRKRLDVLESIVTGRKQ